MLLEKIVAQAHATPQKIAFIHNGVACSYAEFAQALTYARHFFAQQRLPAHSVVVLCVEHLAQAWVLGIALRNLGLTTVSVGQASEVNQLGLDTISCLLTWAPENPPDLTALAARCTCRWLNVPASFHPTDAPAEPTPAQHPGGHIIQTSGTTGAYKKILRDAVAEASTLDLHAQINGISAASMVYVRDFPLWTAGGYRWPLLSWHQGASVVFQQGQDFHLPLLEQPLTHAFATPMTLMFVLHAPELPVRRNDALRLLVTGGAMPRTLVVALKLRLTQQVYAVLASTEALTVSATRIDDLDDLARHQIHPARQVQVVDETEQLLPAGKVGLLRIKILDGVSGYLNDVPASRAFFRDGYFYPGDLAVFHADGRLALCGRVTDVINVLGSKIATAPLEAALQNQLTVDAVCLLSLAPPGADEEVYVAIESQRNLTEAELQTAAQTLLAHLGRVHFHFFRQLPRNPMGKVLRLALRQQLLARLARPD
ncbi:MAG: AMP-binding protein [Rhodoferax sp.]|uniref:AMP-binding protein n=1 Tax=Rhodoferax sp. TaxID=50421 RepID=UPI0027352BDA|nr:AMP-binding protein [Rhodoferax sp.]MDP2678593.1 AMP-binding protein [Rhodoferax sp.]